MRKLVLAAGIVLLLASHAWTAWNVLQINELVFGNAITMFNGSPMDGSIVVTGKVPGQRTAIDLWPHNGLLPMRHALTETVWYRTRFQDWPRLERFSVSAIGNGDAGYYALDVEAGGGGQYRPILACFDGLQPGLDCPFRIYWGNQGVFVCATEDSGGDCYNLLEVARKVMK